MRLRGTHAVIALAGLAALLGVACGRDDADGESPGQCAPLAPAVVDQDSLKFEPSTLCVKAEQEVLFTNSESAIHTVTIEGKNESGTMKRGDEFRWSPPQPGAYVITCEFHPQMKARITVVE